MFLTYDELTDLVPLEKSEKSLDVLFLESANTYVERFLGDGFADSPDSLKKAVLVVFNDRKDWYNKLTNDIGSGKSSFS